LRERNPNKVSDAATSFQKELLYVTSRDNVMCLRVLWQQKDSVLELATPLTAEFAFQIRISAKDEPRKDELLKDEEEVRI
jgi:hypothetical protein